MTNPLHKILIKRETIEGYPKNHRVWRFMGVRTEAKALAELVPAPRQIRHRRPWGYKVFNGDSSFFIFADEVTKL